MTDFVEIEKGIEALKHNPTAVSEPAEHVLALAEQILENWLFAHGLKPTNEKREGFRLLALHRQGARNDSSFNACRETCRELIYQTNLYRLNEDRSKIVLSAMVAMHLLLFIRGKLESQKLGEFCCSSKSLRTQQSSH